MEPITILTKSQLNELEATIYLLLTNPGEDGDILTYRDLAIRLGVTHGYIIQHFNKAQTKVKQLKSAGLLEKD